MKKQEKNNPFSNSMKQMNNTYRDNCKELYSSILILIILELVKKIKLGWHIDYKKLKLKRLIASFEEKLEFIGKSIIKSGKK